MGWGINYGTLSKHNHKIYGLERQAKISQNPVKRHEV